MKYRPKTTPFKHQSRATIAALKARNFAVFFEPRLGKTKVALDYCGVMAMKRGGLKVLVVFPAIARDTWERELRKHYPHFAMCEDFNTEWDVPGNSDYITQFFLASREETFVRRNGESPKRDTVEEWNPDVVVLDESHEYKRPGGRGAQDAWRMVRRLRKLRGGTGLPYVILLSGTPDPKGLRDLFAQFRILDDTIFGTSVADFDERHVRKHPYRKWQILGYRREKELWSKVRANSFAISADEAGMNHHQSFETIRVQLPPKVKKIYLDLAREFVAEWEGGVISAKNPGVKRLRLLQVTGGFTTEGQVLHDSKLRALAAYAKLLLEQDESVLVYCRFTAEVVGAVEALERVGYRPFRVDGSTTAKDRRQALQALGRRRDQAMGGVFQYQAGSRALELVGAAETIFYGPCDSWVDYWGALKRTQGPNQHRPVRYTHLVASGTVDAVAYKGLVKKEDWHATMMRNPRRYLLGLI